MKQPLRLLLLLSPFLFDIVVEGFGGVTSRFFVKQFGDDRPKLILIGGCPGTGKSTFGMSVALDQGILKCISTDTVRAVMRSFVPLEVSPALHRSSYEPAFEGDDPVRSWKETCQVLNPSVQGLVDDALKRGASLVVEGVHVVPGNALMERWQRNGGGAAIGCLLQIADEEKHIEQLRRRGFLTGVTEAEESKIAQFDRIRAIQQEMMKLGREHKWLQIEQRIGPDPLDIVTSSLMGQQQQGNVLWQPREEEIALLEPDDILATQEHRNEKEKHKRDRNSLNEMFS